MSVDDDSFLEQFTIERIIKASAIESNVEVKNGIADLKPYIHKIHEAHPETTPEDIWVAYERCGYDARYVPSYIDHKLNTTPLQNKVDGKEFAEWAVAKKTAFKQMFTNFNAFFYRLRPIGTKLSLGNFDQTEANLFHKRYQYFKQVLGLNDQKWGAFALGIPGKVGYQCASFYRDSYSPGNFKPISFKEKLLTPEEAIRTLNREALEYLFESYSIKVDDETLDRHVEFLASMTSKKAPKTYEKTAVHTRKKKPSIVQKEESSPKPKRKTIVSRARKQIEQDEIRKQVRKNTTKEVYNLAIGARDQVTGIPMANPMMHPDGYVFDASTWLGILEGHLVSPYQVGWFSFEDLVELDDAEFERNMERIKNIYV